ncbi:MAG TPA: sigma-70 family RNA polymerase sigma factor [Candidatus Paceibacterota bacterium]|nr:sigma-70 family RNA polymerase sigma factor [Candidatus Paceibacterota bacterium]
MAQRALREDVILPMENVEIERAYLEAYEKYADELFKRCYMSLRDRDLARDIVQETYTRAWEYLRKGNQIDYFRAFLYRVANNLVVDVARKRRSTSLDALIEENGLEVRDEDAADPEDRVRVREMSRHLQHMSDTYRSIVQMRYLEEKSPRAIAEALGVSENVVSVRLYRGLRQLSKMMEAAPAH